MCKRQIDRRLMPLAPSNDNEARDVTGPTGRKPAFFRSRNPSVFLERTDRVRSELVADGILTIQGQDAASKGPGARR
jgi:hypothetical protein